MEQVELDLDHILIQARDYLKKLTSYESLKQMSPTIALDIKYSRSVNEEAIVLLHVDPSMGPRSLSAILDL